MRSMIRNMTLLVLLVSLTSCGGRLLQLDLGIIKIRLLVDQGVESDLTSAEDRVALGTGNLGTVEGEALTVRDSEIHLGDQNYGSISDGDLIELKPDGVFVEGERRGDLPKDDD